MLQIYRDLQHKFITIGKIMKIDLSKTEKLLEKYKGKRGALIPLLQHVQAAYGYVPGDVVTLIAKELSIFPVTIYGVLTFYTQFCLSPRGKHIIKVCQGTACHVMGGKDILDYLSEELGIKDGETTKDGVFSLERAACLGCCGMAPVITIDDEFHGWLTITKIGEVLDSYKKKALEAGEAK